VFLGKQQLRESLHLKSGKSKSTESFSL